jgi:hypothetical protein
MTIINKINLFAPNPPTGGSKLIFFTPFREGANEENQHYIYITYCKLILQLI